MRSIGSSYAMGLKLSDDIQNCAGHVQSGDPDRFLAIMAAPLHLRGPLFVLTAFNLELARAPWVTKEAMIAEMRLQWWLDAIEEIYAGKQVRRHEVVTPLSDLIKKHDLPRACFDAMIQARRWDIYSDPHNGPAELWRYLEETNGSLMQLGMKVADFDNPKSVKDFGASSGLANIIVARAALRNSQKQILKLDELEILKDMASDGVSKLMLRDATTSDQKAVLRLSWQARTILKRAAASVDAIEAGAVQSSDFSKRLSLLAKAMTGRY